MAKRTKAKGKNAKGRIRRTSRRTGRVPAETPKAAAPKVVVTTDHLQAILGVLNMLIHHAERVASKAQIGVAASRDLLVSKGIFTEAEWDTAFDRVERRHPTLFALDPDAQRAVDEIRRLLDLEEPNGDAPDEGGEA